MHHEGGIAKDILDRLLSIASKRGLAKVKSARVVVGEFLMAYPENIEFSFNIISKGTVAEGTKLGVSLAKVKAKCGACGEEFGIKDLACPGCGSNKFEITSGKELLVDEVE